MKIKSNYFDYKNILSYLSLTFLFAIFNCIENNCIPYSTAILVCAFAENTSIIISSLLYVFSFILTGGKGLLLSSLISAVTLILITLIYRKFKIKPRLEYAIFSFFSLIGYIIIGDTENATSLERRIFATLLISFISFICLITFRAINDKGLKKKFNVEEYASLSIFVCLMGLGLSNLISPLVWKGFSIFIIILSCYLFRAGLGVTISAVMGISLSIYYDNLNYVSVFLILGIICQTLMPISRYVATIILPILDFIVNLIFSIYPAYTIFDALPIIIACILFIVIPTKPLVLLKDKLYAFRERQLERQVINRNRQMLSNRLYEISNVFIQMASAFNEFNKNEISDQRAKEIIEKKIISSTCKICDNYKRCKISDYERVDGIIKMIDIGFAKGKLSLIDLPNDISSFCIHPKDIIFGLNKLLADYRTYLIEKSNIANGRKLIADQVKGIAEVLKSLALESGTLLKYQSKLERKLADSLFKNGFLVSELLIYGEKERLSVSLVLNEMEVSFIEIENVINKTLNTRLTLDDKCNINDSKIYLSFKQTVQYEAVFGIAKETKDNSLISGDTYSVIKLLDGRLLMALSDGMGSGKMAEKVSNVSLSLIESFYKAGMDSTLILNTVNKLLSINTEDSFSALDISVIDLKNCSADFIKYGAPYGFIISKNGIRIVEGNSLPLGIIEDLSPSICQTELNENDIILLLTDGISDAFGSSSEIIDYLRSLPAKNPQTLADNVLNKAKQLSNGTNKDDMSALAVRIYKKPFPTL